MAERSTRLLFSPCCSQLAWPRWQTVPAGTSDGAHAQHSPRVAMHGMTTTVIKEAKPVAIRPYGQATVRRTSRKEHVVAAKGCLCLALAAASVAIADPKPRQHNPEFDR